MGTASSKPTTTAKSAAIPPIGDEPVICPACNEAVNESENVTFAVGKYYHPQHFVCSSCGISLANAPFCVDQHGNVLCEEDYADQVAEKCEGCGKPIVEGSTITTLGRTFHQTCLKCSKCDQQLNDNEQFFADWDTNATTSSQQPPSKRGKKSQNGEDKKEQHNDGEEAEEEKHVILFCKRCNFLPEPTDPSIGVCAWCNEWIDGDGVSALGKRWHEECFVCEDCEEPLLETGQFFEVDGRVFCRDQKCVFMRKEKEASRKRKLEGLVNVIVTPLQRFRRKPAAARTILTTEAETKS